MSDHDDARLFARLRRLWERVDPVPVGMIDRMVAAVASEGLSQEYALLTLVEDEFAAVRGDADALTLQFSDGRSSILLHVTRTGPGRHRVDGWVDATAEEIVLSQDERELVADADGTGRFAFHDVPSGLTAVRLRVVDGDEVRTLSTPPVRVVTRMPRGLRTARQRHPLEGRDA